MHFYERLTENIPLSVIGTHNSTDLLHFPNMPITFLGSKPLVGKPRQSEYLSGFVNADDDGDDEYLGYGVLDSGGEEEEDKDDVCSEDTTGKSTRDDCHGISVSTAAAARIGGEGENGRPKGLGGSGGGCVPVSEDIERGGVERAGGLRSRSGQGNERGDHDGVEPAHIEVRFWTPHTHTCDLAPV